jgi:hypothetical protein
MAELERCIFALIGQAYRPLNICLALQRFTPDEIDATARMMRRMTATDGAPAFAIINWPHPEPHDARSALINTGIEATTGRYLAFLDYDDVLYPEAYALLVSQLNKTGSGISFAGICIKDVDVFDDFVYVKKKRFPFSGKTLLDLFMTNFCPIHSFVLDRSRIGQKYLYFEQDFNKNEDYDFVIRICAKFPSDFTMVPRIIGDYYLKSDGSNSILTESASTAENYAGWAAAEDFVESRRRTTLVSADVQRALGVDPPLARLTIRDLLTRKAMERSG